MVNQPRAAYAWPHWSPAAAKPASASATRRMVSSLGPLRWSSAMATRTLAVAVPTGIAWVLLGRSLQPACGGEELAFRAFDELDNGITYINAPTIGAEAHLPFGGVKQTGNGHREGGWQVYEFYSETKVGYADFSGTLQRAQIDNYLGTPD